MNLKFLCRHIGGSHAYGLNTPDSDIDYRGVYVSDDLGHILGIDKDTHQITQNETEDSAYFELRRFLCLLRKSCTTSVETLYNTDWLEIDPYFVFMQEQVTRENLIDSDKLYKSLKGYLFGEMRLATGERTGQLGGKRKAALEKFGFSPKNFVQLLRLCWAGQEFFQTGVFPVYVIHDLGEGRQILLDIKTHPEHYTKERLISYAKEQESYLDKSYANRQYNSKFDTDLANEICHRCYEPFLPVLER